MKALTGFLAKSFDMLFKAVFDKKLSLEASPLCFLARWPLSYLMETSLLCPPKIIK